MLGCVTRGVLAGVAGAVDWWQEGEGVEIIKIESGRERAVSFLHTAAN